MIYGINRERANFLYRNYTLKLQNAKDEAEAFALLDNFVSKLKGFGIAMKSIDEFLEANQKQTEEYSKNPEMVAKMLEENKQKADEL